MPVSDEIRQEHKKVKNMTPKEKLSYFWDYYKYHTIGTIVAVFLIFTLVHDIVTSKEYAFCAVYFNSVQAFDTNEYGVKFAEYAGIDLEEYDILLDNTMYYSLTDLSETSMATAQKFAAMVQSREVDVVLSDEDIFANYAKNEMFYDLREVLPQDLMEQYEDNLFYIDWAEVEARDKAMDEYWSSEDDSAYYEELERTFSAGHRDPSVMENPIPIGIYVGDAPQMTETQCYPGTDPVFGIVRNTEKLETALMYLRFLGE